MKPDNTSAPIWSTLGLPDVLARLHVDASQGLTATDAAARLQRYGANALRGRGGERPWPIAQRQLTAALPLILLAAALIALGSGDFKTAGALTIVIALNILLGFGQNYRSGRMLTALQRTAPPARVRREGQEQVIAAGDIVPGDIVFLETGKPVPADGRLIEAVNLRIQEAILTGDASPAEKITAAPGPNIALGYRRNMAFMGTTVTHGHGLMAVTETGMATQLGRIISLVGASAAPTPPLARWLTRWGREAALVIVLLIAAAVGVGLWRGASPGWIAEAAISVAIAGVPVGLPLVVTIALAVGGRQMLRRRALVRRPAAAATAGAATVICADKVGVLTEARLAIAALDLTGQRVDLVATCHNREPVILPDESDPLTERESSTLRLLLGACALCNDAELRPDPGRPGHFHALGDPADGAQVVAAARCGLWQADLNAAYPRVAAAPFDATRSRMTTLHQVSTDVSPQAPLASFFRSHYPLLPLSWVSFTRGPLPELCERIEHVWVGDHAEPFDEVWRSRLDAAAAVVGQGMRIHAVAFRAFASDLADDPDALPAPPTGPDLERGLTLIGLIGVAEPPRPDTPRAVAACRAAGIRPALLTADRPSVARQVAEDLGFAPAPRVLTGRQTLEMKPEALERAVEEVAVFAEVSAGHKLNLVRAFQRSGQIVALTGDSADDAPALAAADIGVAMGASGADVAQDAADVILLDGSFAALLAAVEAGRGILANTRRFIGFALAGAIGRAMILMATLLLGLPLAFTPLQLLYMSLVSDSLLGVGLSSERSPEDALRRPPPPRDESLFGRNLSLPILGGGALIGAIGLGLGLIAGMQEMHELRWDTLLATTVVCAQAFRALTLRTPARTGLIGSLRASPWLLAAALLAIGLHLAVISAPALRATLGFTPLSLGELAGALAAGSLTLWAGELIGWLQEAWSARRARP